ncbi:hypothetical protein AZH90_004375 [Salmonella enterica subsp. enterica serovar Legon]|nr:hypothetical protein [Salmonella enterica subsp. enterica serovar Weybridge]EDS6807101.1 hypothetical protein [Salmonella enterica subsp. enterica serovar Legon]EDW9825517.1 hypothetical protein [Salmonella enterica]EDZ3589508.1 hypothetical protein [Salmonella enterica subsp. enterica serovar Wagenia]EHL5833778.1 hypothetical protein [Salmonella enterica]
MKDAFILACSEYFVNNRHDKKMHRHPRKRHETLPAEAIARRPKVLGKVVTRAERRHLPVRIPAMTFTELGHLLRSLELSRACA